MQWENDVGNIHVQKDYASGTISVYPPSQTRAVFRKGCHIGDSRACLKAAARCRLLLCCAQATGKVVSRMLQSGTGKDEMWQAVLMKEMWTAVLSEKCSVFQHKRQDQPQPVPLSPPRTAVATTFNLNHNSTFLGGSSLSGLTECDVKHVKILKALVPSLKQYICGRMDFDQNRGQTDLRSFQNLNYFIS